MEPLPPCSHPHHTIDGNAMDIAAPSSHAPIGTAIQSDAAMERSAPPYNPTVVSWRLHPLSRHSHPIPIQTDAMER